MKQTFKIICKSGQASGVIFAETSCPEEAKTFLLAATKLNIGRFEIEISQELDYFTDR